MPELGTEIRRYYESVVERVDPMRPIVQRAPRVDYSTRTGAAIAVVAASIVVLLFGLLPLLLPSEPAEDPVTTVTTPTTRPPTVSTTLAEPPEAGGYANPLLSSFYRLDACDDTVEFESWMSESVSDSYVVELVESDIETVMTVIPLYRSPDAVCVSAFVGTSPEGVLEVAGWMLLDASGELIARAVGYQTDGSEGALIDDPELQALNGEYHQDWVGSGQSFTGWVADGLVAADVGLGAGVWMRTFIELPGYLLPTVGRVEGRAGADVVALLSLGQLTPIREGSELVLPSVLPDGVFRCMGPNWNGQISPIREVLRVTSYCDETSVVLEIGSSAWGFSPPETFEGTIEIAGVTFNRYRVEGEDLLLTASLPYGMDLIVRSSLDLNTQLAEILASIELVELGEGFEGIASIHSGSDNYRSIFSEQWVRDQLEATGATNVRVDLVTLESGVEGFEATFQPASDTSLELTGYFSTYPLDRELTDPFEGSERQTYEQVTIFILRPQTGQAPKYQAVAYCGGITLHAVGEVAPATDPNPVIDTIRSLIYNIDC